MPRQGESLSEKLAGFDEAEVDGDGQENYGADNENGIDIHRFKVYPVDSRMLQYAKKKIMATITDSENARPIIGLISVIIFLSL